ncbi:polyribonucleotide nucleotidyltransferase [Babesia caballi]|uniref:Polyribonucleotide nucleotidyltransferase n=1 Tax=Babesia caballi TaxID=5871 RepID=A0AAV4LNU7_BABCB|nr:polyribonucleotide nucleotidyltransferase [Babesia caballi]
MDRSYDFKRRTTHWQQALGPAPSDASGPTPDHNTVDRFSLLSAEVFAQLHVLRKLIEPYTVVPQSSSGKEIIGGRVEIPAVPNAVGYIQAKRALFEQTDIKDVVHDTRVAGDLIKQMATSIEEELKRLRRKTFSRQLQEHRLGVVACLQHSLKAVQAAVEQYERYRLKVETNLTAALRAMTEDLVKEIRMRKGMSSEVKQDKLVIAEDYLKLFVEERGRGAPAAGADGATQPASSAASPRSSPVDGAQVFGRRSPSFQGSPHPGNVEYGDAERGYDAQTLEMQHKALVDRVEQSIQASELNTINNVQQRLSEISSMFEQFSGTLAVQLDMFESISANVLESLSNIETTESTLQKSNEEGMSYYQLMMCYSFARASVALEAGKVVLVAVALNVLDEGVALLLEEQVRLVVHVVEDAGSKVEVLHLLDLANLLEHVAASLLDERVVALLVPETAVLEVLADALDAVVAAGGPGLELAGPAVLRRLVGGAVVAETEAKRSLPSTLKTLTGAAPFLPDGGHAVGDAADGNAVALVLVADGGGDGVAVVAAGEDCLGVAHGGHVHGGVEVALGGGALAEEGDGAGALLGELQRVAGAGGVRELGSEGGADGVDVALPLGVGDGHLAALALVAAVREELVQRVVHGEALAVEHAELAGKGVGAAQGPTYRYWPKMWSSGCSARPQPICMASSPWFWM